MIPSLDFDPDHGMVDNQLLEYWRVAHGYDRSRSWLRNARALGNAPPFWREGLKAKTSKDDADAHVTAIRSVKFTSTAEERMHL